jgi:hypothetical protein
MALVEVVMAGTIAMVLVCAVGVLLDGGNRAWLRTYNLTNSDRQEAAKAIVAAFGSIGRRSNRASYVLYRIDHGVFTAVQPDASQPQSVGTGAAVEFRCWDVELDASDSHHLMDVDRAATTYELFYLEGGCLKVDQGTYPPGAVPAGGGPRNTAGVSTRILAGHVTNDVAAGPFSHTFQTGVGQGCVRLNLVLTDPASGETTRVMTAALMRNIWPR